MSTLWTPDYLDTTLWLDASAASTITTVTGVSNWADKKGNGKNAVQATGGAQPLVQTAALNGLNVIRFDGTDDILSCNHTFAIENQSCFTVFRAVAGSVQFAMGMRPAADSRWYVTSSEMQKGSSNHLITNDTLFKIGYLSGSSTQRIASENGATPNAASDTNTGTTENTFIGGANQDGSSNNINHYANVDIAEIVYVLGTPTEDDRQKIEGYLAHKWGLEASLAEGHPYETTAPVLPTRTITITDLKDPNAANSAIANATGVQVKLWVSTDSNAPIDTGAPDVLFSGSDAADIVSGTMELIFTSDADIGASVLGVAKWSDSNETYFFPIDTTVEDESSGP